MWREPIFDRTRRDIDEKRAKGFCNTADLERIEDNCAEVGRLLGTAVQNRSALWTDTDLPTEGELCRILSNINLLNTRYRAYETTPAPPAAPFNHWEKWNAAEKILHDIRMNYLDNRAARNYSGEISGGERIGIL